MKIFQHNIRSAHYIIPIILITGILGACIKTTPVSEIPEVTFKDINVIQVQDSLGNIVKRVVLEFDFIDGDADIGMFENVGVDTIDTIPPEDKNNVLLTLYYKEDSMYFEAETDSTYPENYYRIPYNEKLNRVGQNKTIKGTVKLNIDFYIDPEYDTMKYDFFIKDRADHESNVAESKDFSLNGI